MTDPEAARRAAEELCVTCDHTWGEVRGKGACAACVARYVATALAQARQEERERCARLVETWHAEARYIILASGLAAMLRRDAGGEGARG